MTVNICSTGEIVDRSSEYWRLLLDGGVLDIADSIFVLARKSGNKAQGGQLFCKTRNQCTISGAKTEVAVDEN